jgi:hypothetical protein
MLGQLCPSRAARLGDSARHPDSAAYAFARHVRIADVLAAPAAPAKEELKFRRHSPRISIE